jgi:hypothetical protein
VWQVLSDFIPVRTDELSRDELSRPAFTSNQEPDSVTLTVGGR